MGKDRNVYRILVIEDNPGDFILVEEFLQEQFERPVIVQAGNYKESASILSAGGASFDVVLLDLTLPDKSGQELISEILQLASPAPIIILTGYTDVEFSISSISQGILDYLLKDDLNAAMLYKSIIYAIERRRIVAELKKSEKRYSDLFHFSPQPMWVYDMETLGFIQVNKAAVDHYGYSEEEFLDMSILDITPEDEIERTKEVIGRHRIDDDGAFKGNFGHRIKSGERIDVEIYSTPITISDKNFRSVIAIDVTEKNHYEQKIVKAIIKTQEDERYEFGSELHDNVCQILATSLISLGMIKKGLKPEEMEWLNKCREYITMASDEIRNLSHRLAPAFFGDTTLKEIFLSLLDDFNLSEYYKITLYFDEAITQCPVNREVQLNLYRILQEQLKNILKYSKADRVGVEVFIYDDNLTMMTSDNGIGFDVKELKSGIGFANMKRRAELFYGHLRIESWPGKGCSIFIDIPLKEIRH